MLAVLVCIVAFSASYLAGRRALWLGLSCVIAWGYFYGILRANILSPSSHFIFDSALLGLYCSQLFQSANVGQQTHSHALRNWILALIIWPCLLVFLPFQNALVSLVGLRGNIFFLPMCLIGARLKNRDLSQFAFALAALNLVAVLFAIGEYMFGIDRLYPVSPVTAIIYASRDVASYQYYRLPAIFANAHAYAGTMVMTLPFLVGAWFQRQRSVAERILVLAGILSAGFGILVANARTHMVIGALLLTMFLFVVRGRGVGWYRLAWCVLATVAVFSALRTERFGSRVLSLSDTDYVVERLQGSVNRTFLEILLEYPMGNGLGGGGTSMPYFLTGLVRTPIAMESEYARILLEQGIIGLALWVGFIAWFVTSSFGFIKVAGARIAFVACCAYLASGMTGLGMLTSIPQSVLVLLAMGWVVVRPDPESAPQSGSLLRRAATRGRHSQETYAY